MMSNRQAKDRILLAPRAHRYAVVDVPVKRIFLADLKLAEQEDQNMLREVGHLWEREF